MTDRFNALIVVLEEDVREDDAEQLIAVIRHLRGVVNVAGNVADMASYIAEQRAYFELRNKIGAILYPPAPEKVRT